ncbi:MAG: alpha/beta hydrolase, partial [Vicinamibacteria bacterium]
MLFEEKLIYFPSNEVGPSPEDLGLEHEEVVLVASDGTRIHGWFLPARGSGFTVLVCHGNSGNIADRLDRVLKMHGRLGVDVFLFDYRGFGRSEGTPDEEGTYRDAVAAYR